jgi:hypothetical protein
VNARCVAVDKHNAILERVRFLKKPADEGDDRRLVGFTVDKSDTVASP